MKYHFKTKPYKHQTKALRKVVRNNGGALFMPMRSGKTKTAIDWAACMHLKHGASRVLVVCPLSVKGVWKKQIRIHLPDEFHGKIRWKLVHYEKVFDRDMNGDGTWTPIPRRTLYRWSPDVIIVDESHKIGNPTTVQSAELYKLQRELAVNYKLILTGTPFHRKVMMLFGQFKFLDERLFGTAWGKFKSRYGKWGGYGGFKFLGTRRKTELMRKVSPISFMMKTLPVVPPQYEVIPYKLKESEKAYESMANEFIAWIGDGVVEAPIALVKALRLAQICGGRLKDSEGKLQRVGYEKRNAFEAWLNDQLVDYQVKKFVVFCRFVPELKDVVDTVRAAGYRPLLMYGATPGPLREQRIAEFEETEEPSCFISQVATGSLGIDLSAASICVFYSLPESLVDYDQACARIRKYKDQRTLSYYYFTAEGTIEEVQLSTLRANLGLIDTIERDPMLLSYTARG